jgi:hypothetical protein
MSKQDSGQGALFENTRRNKDSQPNFRGDLTLTKPLLKELVEMAKAGKEIKMSLSVWNKRARSGTEYMSIAAQAYVEYKKDGDSDNRRRDPEPEQEPQKDINDDDVPF